MYILRHKNFTLVDRTDNIKRMNDSDIIAEKKKSNVNSYANAVKTGVVGAGVGAIAGGAAGLVKKTGLGGGTKGLATGGKYGAIAGAALGAGASLLKGHKKREDNRSYNRRLDYAQRQAHRRERKDWSNNMTGGREGYTY